MPTTIRLQGEPDFLAQALVEIEREKLVIVPLARMRNLPQTAEIAVALGSAGAFTALYQVINKLLDKNTNRELRLERQGLSISIKAHSLPEEQLLLAQLAPELAKRPDDEKESDGSKLTIPG